MKKTKYKVPRLLPNREHLLKWIEALEEYNDYISGLLAFKPTPPKYAWKDAGLCPLCSLSSIARMESNPEPYLSTCAYCVWTRFNQKDTDCIQEWYKHKPPEEDYYYITNIISKLRSNLPLHFVTWRQPILRKQLTFLRWLLARTHE